MKRLLLVILLIGCLWSESLAKEIKEDHMEFGSFGSLAVYSLSSQPSHVVLFVSGDGGWNLGVVEMARELASMDALVVGIDIVRYFKQLESQSEGCAYPAGDFEMLSKFVQKKMNYPRYVTPVLLGYSSGATLVYAVLAQAPPDTFQWAISMGFCPDLLLPKPLCRGSGLEWEIGVNSLKYFWKKKSPETATADLERILKTYMAVWKRDKAVLIGYSLGADVLPFMANRLSPELLEQVALITLLGPDSEVDWEFHLTDWLGGGSRNSVRVLPEVEKLANKYLLCIYGEEEATSLCPQLSGSRMRVVAFKGAHHFGGDYESIAKLILNEIWP
jgi:type IV secretory pathway VirJ component